LQAIKAHSPENRDVPGGDFFVTFWDGWILSMNVQLIDLMVARDGVEPPTPAFSGL